MTGANNMMKFNVTSNGLKRDVKNLFLSLHVHVLNC